MSTIKDMGVVTSAELDEEGRIVARIRIFDGRVAQELMAYFGVPLSTHMILSSEAKEQLVAALPGISVTGRSEDMARLMFGASGVSIGIGEAE